MTKPVLIRYARDVPAKDGRRAFIAGEEYVVPSSDDAARVHPDAKIVGHEDGTPLQRPTAAKESHDKASKAQVGKRGDDVARDLPIELDKLAHAPGDRP
ncbi:MAG: hypothetical protein ACR2OO_04035 [Thermomicrobiales bacterium]